MSKTKNVPLDSMKKIQKGSDDSWCKKWLWMSNFGTFLDTSTLHQFGNSQNSMISFDYSWYLAKKLSNFVSLS